MHKIKMLVYCITRMPAGRVRQYRRKRLPNLPRKVKSNTQKINKLLRSVEHKYATYSDTNSKAIQRMDQTFAIHTADATVTCLDLTNQITQGLNDTFQRVGDKSLLTSIALSYMVSPSLTLTAGVIPHARVFLFIDNDPVLSNGTTNYPTFDTLFQGGAVNVDETAGGSANSHGALAFRSPDHITRYRMLYSKVHRCGSLGGSGLVRFGKVFKKGMVMKFSAAGQTVNNFRIYLVMTTDQGQTAAANNRPLLSYMVRIRYSDS